MQLAYLNNRFIPLNKAKISVLDRGFLYGDGVFETMRSYDGVVFYIEKHIKRLFKSLKALHINPKIKPQKIQSLVYKLLHKNRLKNAYIKIITTRGISEGLLAPSGKISPTTLIYTHPYKPLPEKTYEKGIKVLLSSVRSNEGSQIVRNKTLNYLHNVLCRYEAKKKGFEDAVLINTKDFVSEASSSNIFLVKGKRIYTPSLDSGILAGITRREIIRLAKRFLNKRINETFIKTADLYSANEIFLTNSLVEIMPVVRVGGHVIGKGKAGPITAELRRLYKASVWEYARNR